MFYSVSGFMQRLLNRIPAVFLVGILTWHQLASAGVNPPLTAPLSFVEQSNRLLQEARLINDNIADLESLFGPYDATLLEPLQKLTTNMIESGDYPAAEELLERQFHIARINQGFNSDGLIPILENLLQQNIENDNWNDASISFEWLYALRLQNLEDGTADRLEYATDLKNWYLNSILLGGPDLWEQQGNRIGELQTLIMDQVEATYAADSVEIIPWLYQDTIDEFRTVTVSKIRNHIGKAPRILLRGAAFRTRDQSRSVAINNMIRARRILESAGDREAEAMAMIYHADLRLLFDRGNAPALYRDAMDKLLEAGVAADKIDLFFSRPTVIPTPEFYMTIDEAIAAQDEQGYRAFVSEDGARTVNLGSFHAWHVDFPGVARPTQPDLLSELSQAYHSALLEFSLTSRGDPRSIDPVFADSTSDQKIIDAIKGVRALRFRPQFVDRRWRRLDQVQIEYFYPIETEIQSSPSPRSSI